MNLRYTIDFLYNPISRALYASCVKLVSQILNSAPKRVAKRIITKFEKDNPPQTSFMFLR